MLAFAYWPTWLIHSFDWTLSCPNPEHPIQLCCLGWTSTHSCKVLVKRDQRISVCKDAKLRFERSELEIAYVGPPYEQMIIDQQINIFVSKKLTLDTNAITSTVAQTAVMRPVCTTTNIWISIGITLIEWQAPYIALYVRSSHRSPGNQFYSYATPMTQNMSRHSLELV